MSIEDAAKVLLSGEYSRRRGYLSAFINSWNGLALTGTLAIWAWLVRWDALEGKTPNPELFATQIGWAGAVSSFLLGVWRLHARNLDDSIIRLYPVSYLLESAVIPENIRTIKPPKGVQTLSKGQASGELSWAKVRNRDFRGRGHHFLDLIASLLIIAFGVTSVKTASSLGVTTITWPPDRIGWLLLGNIIGLVLVLGACLWWRNRQLDWPIPKEGRNENTGTA